MWQVADSDVPVWSFNRRAPVVAGLAVATWSYTGRAACIGKEIVSAGELESVEPLPSLVESAMVKNVEILMNLVISCTLMIRYDAAGYNELGYSRTGPLQPLDYLNSVRFCTYLV